MRQNKAEKRPYRIGIELGPSYLGWCVIDLDDAGNPTGIRDMGVRIFAEGRDPKSGASLAVERRLARSARRRRDRFVGRRKALMKALVKFDLMPADATDRNALETLDPFALRAAALDDAIPLYHLGRALFHLNQRRGFKSNRKADRGNDEEKGKIATGIARLAKAMRDSGARTFGEFLHRRRRGADDPRRTPPVRARLHAAPDSNGYEFYPDRAMLEQEFDAIWTAQTRHHPKVLTPEMRSRLASIMFHQRPLKRRPVGRCMFFDDERLPKAHPLLQDRRVYEEVNALEIEIPGEASRKLTLDERDKVVAKLQNAKSASFSALRTLLKLPDAARFNRESERLPKLTGNEVRAALSRKDRFGPKWAILDLETQTEVIKRLREEDEEGRLTDWLEQLFGIETGRARRIASVALPEGYGRLGEKATRLLLDMLQAEVITRDEALARCAVAYPEMTDQTAPHGDGAMAHLPYYAKVLERHVVPGTYNPDEEDDAVRYGRIANPTFHIGLNQLRRVMNDIIRIHGRPVQITAELARDLKLSDEQKRRANALGRKNAQASERRSAQLRELKQRDTGANRLLLKLWEELNPDDPSDRLCVYSGEAITPDMLFNGTVELNYILPRSRTLDETDANRTLCLTAFNRQKRGKSPYEAFGPDKDRWAGVISRAARLPRNKRWRFQPNAMERFESEKRSFVDRQLIDGHYLSRLARRYLETVCPGDQAARAGVFVIPGRMTEMLRRKWGLNPLLPDHNLPVGAGRKKDRLDHRHHAIDASVIGVTDRALLTRIAAETALAEDEARLDHDLGDIDPPWTTFRADLGAALERVVVSHRPDQGCISMAARRATGRDRTAGRLHNDTAYGLTGKTDDNGNEIVVVRKPIESLTRPADIERIRDPELRAALREKTQGLSGGKFGKALRAFATDNERWPGLRRVRIIESIKTVKVRDRTGAAYKGYKGDSNYRYDVWELPDGKWVCDVVTMFDAHQRQTESPVKREYPTARKIMRLHQNDMLAIEHEDGEIIVRVVKFSISGNLTMAGHLEGGALKARDAQNSDADPFKYIYASANALKKRKARKIRIDALGRVHDPGPRA